MKIFLFERDMILANGFSRGRHEAGGLGCRGGMVIKTLQYQIMPARRKQSGFLTRGHDETTQGLQETQPSTTSWIQF